MELVVIGRAKGANPLSDLAKCRDIPEYMRKVIDGDVSMHPLEFIVNVGGYDHHIIEGGTTSASLLDLAMDSVKIYLGQLPKEDRQITGKGTEIFMDSARRVVKIKLG